MVEYIGKKMVVDTRAADGGAYFESDHFLWKARGYYPKLDIIIYYKDIRDVIVVNGRKKRVEVYTNNGQRYDFYLYKAATFAEFINSGIEACKHPEIEQKSESKAISDEDLIRLKQLSDLHKDGVLSDEQFDTQKNEILKKYN